MWQHLVIQAEHVHITLICESLRIPSRNGLHMNLRMCHCLFWNAFCSGWMRFLPFQQNMQNFSVHSQASFELSVKRTALPFPNVAARKNTSEAQLVQKWPDNPHLDSVCLNMVDGHSMNFDDMRQQTLQTWGITFYITAVGVIWCVHSYISYRKPIVCKWTPAVVTLFKGRQDQLSACRPDDFGT